MIRTDESNFLLRMRNPAGLLRTICCCLFALAAVCGGTKSARAVTPDSPEVKALVTRATKFLEQTTHEQVGGKVLIAIALKQNGRDISHPKIKEALDECLKYATTGNYGDENYNLALAIIFLCEMEDSAQRPQVQKMLTDLLGRQKPNGSWSYTQNTTGDTSQTQYAVLALWSAARHGYDVPLPAIEGVLNWLIRTQDPSGGWGYQGNDPGPGGNRIAQSPLTLSLGAAALGSIYILTDLLQLPEGLIAPPKGPAVKKLPPALQEIQDKRANQGRNGKRVPASVDFARLKKTMDDGKNFVQKVFTAEIADWTHYAYYAYERYESFREIAEGDFPPEPKWYTDLYKSLNSSVEGDGYWNSSETPASGTAFSVLVLSRSTRKVIKRIEALGEGILLGGMGLPPNTADLKERNGKLVDSPLSGTVDELLGILEDDSNPELARLAESNQVVALDPDITRRAGQINRLRAMVSAGAYETRLVAVRSLAKVRDLDNVPALLYALSDPDIRIVREADRGLRFNSRKLLGVVELDTPTKETLAELRARWRAWFLSIRPDAELLD
ncbi:hypothetical protein ETAA8_07830 [Anatilimnocola aggregata]|uniref:Uncharacterized protein n=1 Tax=Anatilimnocola aggregata TaxID=2528021 RepID=A0A517Y655_9BACT|nr:hypothetical protein [Anatilimnocola aggregata]QDU25713.1 hypothetical protein ETAA8_07830 [Anatilimnocola aggregata]